MNYYRLGHNWICNDLYKLGRYLFIYLFIETYLYRVDTISSQVIFPMWPVLLQIETRKKPHQVEKTGEGVNTMKQENGKNNGSQ